MQGSIPLASRTSFISTIRKAKPTYLSTLRSMRRLRPGLSASDQKARGLVQAEGASLVSRIINTLLAAPRLFAPGGVAPPRHSAHYASSARLARHENPQANRATY